MTALEEIKKPLEGRDIATLTNVELVTEISRLLGENDKLRDLTAHLRLQAQTHAMEARSANSTIAEIYQIISGGKGEPGNWNGAEPVRKYAEAAEAEVKRLREKLEPFSKFAGVLFERNFNRTDSVAEMTDVDDIPHLIFAGSFFDARQALASTGGEHHAE